MGHINKKYGERETGFISTNPVRSLEKADGILNHLRNMKMEVSQRITFCYNTDIFIVSEVLTAVVMTSFIFAI
jgi:hypothetical protein